DPYGATDDAFGAALAGLPDVTGDGVPDIAVGSPGDDTSVNNDSGSVVIFSGATCERVRKCADPVGLASDNLGMWVTPLPDLDGDGIADFAAGSPDHPHFATATVGSTLVFSGADCSVLLRLVDPAGTPNPLGA